MMFGFFCLCGKVELSKGSRALDSENAKIAHRIEENKEIRLPSVSYDEDSDNIGGAETDDDVVLWFGQKQISLSSRDSKRLSLQDCRNILGICKSHWIRAEGTYKELPDESLVCDLIKENRTIFNSSPRTDQNAICMICQEGFKENDSICTSHQCGHQLHSHCAAQAFKFSTRCPCCRTQWKSYDQYCPRAGLLEKHNSFERELHVDDPLNDFVPDEFLNVPADNSEISESPMSFDPNPPRRRYLPRTFGESRISVVDRRDPGRSTRAESLRSLGRTFRFSESLLDVIDASPSLEEEVASPVEHVEHLDSDSEEELSVSRGLHELVEHSNENMHTCRICNRQECMDSGPHSMAQCQFCEHYLHFDCDNNILSGACTYCTQNSRNLVE